LQDYIEATLESIRYQQYTRIRQYYGSIDQLCNSLR
jgi:hypothetical protein